MSINSMRCATYHAIHFSIIGAQPQGRYLWMIPIKQLFSFYDPMCLHEAEHVVLMFGMNSRIEGKPKIIFLSCPACSMASLASSEILSVSSNLQ